MLNGFELNSVEVNHGVIATIDGAGDAAGNASAVGNELVTRYTPGAAVASSTLSGTAYPIRPHSGSLVATATLSVNEVNAIRHATGNAGAFAHGVGYIEAVVYGGGYAIATAELVGIPANDLGAGDAVSGASLVADGTRIKFDDGAAAASAAALNSDFDVVRNAAMVAFATATALGEPAVNDVLDASGSAEAFVTVIGDSLVDALSSGNSSVSSGADGYANIVKAGAGSAQCSANLLDQQASIYIGASGDLAASAQAQGLPKRTQYGAGVVFAEAKHFVRARAYKKGYVEAQASADATADALRAAYSSASIVAMATAQAVAVRVVIPSSSINATAIAVGGVQINPFTYAPIERTVTAKASGRLVVVPYELREIRVAA